MLFGIERSNYIESNNFGRKCCPVSGIERIRYSGCFITLKIEGNKSGPTKPSGFMGIPVLRGSGLEGFYCIILFFAVGQNINSFIVFISVHYFHIIIPCTYMLMKIYIYQLQMTAADRHHWRQATHADETQIVQMVLMGCISRSRGLKIGFQNATFKNLLVWKYKAQSFHIWCLLPIFGGQHKWSSVNGSTVTFSSGERPRARWALLLIKLGVLVGHDR